MRGLFLVAGILGAFPPTANVGQHGDSARRKPRQIERFLSGPIAANNGLRAFDVAEKAR
jgi:hypothetical protein